MSSAEAAPRHEKTRTTILNPWQRDLVSQLFEARISEMRAAGRKPTPNDSQFATISKVLPWYQRVAINWTPQNNRFGKTIVDELTAYVRENDFQGVVGAYNSLESRMLHARVVMAKALIVELSEVVVDEFVTEIETRNL